MDLLVVETLEADVLEWLGLRHSIRHAPDLAHSPEMAFALFSATSGLQCSKISSIAAAT